MKILHIDTDIPNDFKDISLSPHATKDLYKILFLKKNNKVKTIANTKNIIIKNHSNEFTSKFHTIFFVIHNIPNGQLVISKLYASWYARIYNVIVHIEK